MTEEQTTTMVSPIDYIHRAVTILSEAWMRPYPNRSGMRAAFRRWRPDLSQEPTHEMRDYIWAWMGAPNSFRDQEEIEGASTNDMRIVDRAAVLVSLRAVAGDHPATQSSFGAAIKAADLSDMRLIRLLTMPRSMRLEALHRVLRLLDKKGVGFPWKGRQGRRDVDRMIQFLFGTEGSAQRSANQWAADFFALRGKTASDSEKPSQESPSTSQE